MLIFSASDCDGSIGVEHIISLIISAVENELKTKKIRERTIREKDKDVSVLPERQAEL